MKKRHWLLFLLVLLIFTQSSFPAAAEYKEHDAYEVYGICVVSKILDYDEKLNLDSFLDLETYEKIINFWFGAKTVADANPTNADAIYDLSRFAPEVKNSEHKITSFKDYGFIKKTHRYAYRVMCNAGYLDFEEEFLHPNYPLSYRKLFELLSHFESYARELHGYEVQNGVITDSLSEKNNIVIKLNTESGEKRFEFSRMHSFYVGNGNLLMPYSFNLKRGSYARIYTQDDVIIFASLPEKEKLLDDKYEIYKYRMFLCNEYDKEIIFLNNSGSYEVYKYNRDSMIFEGKDEKQISDINITLIDRPCYAIIEKDTRMIKYINITG